MRPTPAAATVVSTLAALAPAALGQSFTNGNFETGDLTGWTVTTTANGQTASQTVQSMDIDGPGPLGLSMAAQFQVGQVSSVFNDFEGIELTQSLTLAAGVQYQLSLNWAATRTGTVNNAEGGVFTLFAGTVNIASQSAGSTNSATPHYGLLTGAYTPTSTGPVMVGVRITRPYTVPGDLSQWVDNISITGQQACYANCDGSTAAPILNVQDFTCFLQKFAAADPYANCDASTAAPTLNVQDFTCFLQKFAAGCS
jgi:hypothetical protein